ncbi:MAG: S46 family peptidase, partial [Acidobacteriota bacterium]
MNQKKTALLSLVLTVAITLSSLSFAFARMDEGMYTPDRIASLGSMLKKRGLKISPEEIYNPKGGGLSEAVIQLSVGCTAEFVSPDGLILTNHHCGFDAVSSASTPEKDLIELGFKADNRAGEIQAKDYTLNITQRVEDVTSRIRNGTENLSGEALAAAIKKNTDELTTSEQAKAPTGSTIRIQMLNNGYFHYLYQTQQIKDIRVVYAPPRNIGIFGGDPDNFEWTRHTGDFTFLRAYTAPDGSAATYSPNNVPMKVKKYLAVSLNGLKDDDFVFVLGYPGSTTRYREASSIEFARDANYPFLYKWLQARSDALKLIGESDEKKRIDFQSDIASFDNARKLYYGRSIQLRRAEVVQKRQAEESQFTKWIAADPARQQKYGSVLSELAAMTAESNRYAKRDVIVRRIPDPQMTIFGQVYAAVSQSRALSDSERPAKLAEIQKALAGREPVYEREMLEFFLRAFSELPEGQKFDWYEQ